MDYKQLYLKYKKKYYNLKGGVELTLLNDSTSFNTIHLNRAISDAHLAGYELIKNIPDKHKIVSAESLTSGLISAVLANIPYGGHVKYGGFIVYDTDAKRTMLGVVEEDVYTHKCVEQMAASALKNSNATIAIAVTGNSMPRPDNNNKMGEVFIGIAGYVSNSEIYVETSVHNFCDLTDYCEKWYNDNLYKFAPLQMTESLSLYIRYKTVQKALELCDTFVKNNMLVIPDFIKDDRIVENHVNKTDKIMLLNSKNLITNSLFSSRADININSKNISGLNNKLFKQ